MAIEYIEKFILGPDMTGILTDLGNYYVAGSNAYGELGLNDKVNRNTFTKVNIDNVKEVAYGDDHTYILKNDNSVWVCGENDYNELGERSFFSGKVSYRTYFTKTYDDIKGIYLGDNCSFILKNDDTLWAIGNNSYNKLGLTPYNPYDKFTKIEIDNVKNVYPSITSSHTIILKNDGTVWGCGRNDHGQLGLGDNDNRSAFTKIEIDNVKKIICENSYTSILKNDGTVWITGYNGAGELGLGDTNNRNVFTKIDIDNVKDIQGGNDFISILKNDGTVYSCGSNGCGQLGLGDTTRRSNLTKSVDNVKEIVCTELNTLIIKNDNTIWMTGRNYCGNLGLGDTNDRNVFTEITSQLQALGLELKPTTVNRLYKKYSLNIKSFLKLVSFNDFK